MCRLLYKQYSLYIRVDEGDTIAEICAIGKYFLRNDCMYSSV